MEDKILITLLKKNARNAYSTLFDQYFERLYLFALHVVFREDVAHDIVQEIFIRLYEKSETLNHELSLKTYLFNSVRNRCFNYLRDQKVEDRRQNLYAEACIWSENVDLICEADVFERVAQAMDKLPGKCRDICQLRFMDGRSYKEIADQFNMSESTVRVQVARGIEKLKQYFTGSDIAVILFFFTSFKKADFL